MSSSSPKGIHGDWCARVKNNHKCLQALILHQISWDIRFYYSYIKKEQAEIIFLSAFLINYLVFCNFMGFSCHIGSAIFNFETSYTAFKSPH